MLRWACSRRWRQSRGQWALGQRGKRSHASRAQSVRLGLQKTSEIVGRAPQRCLQGMPLNCTPKAITMATLLLIGILRGTYRSNLKSRQKLGWRLPGTRERAGWGVSAWLSSGLPLGRKLLGPGRGGGGTECHLTSTFQWLSLYYVSFKKTCKVNAKMIKETDRIKTVNT